MKPAIGRGAFHECVLAVQHNVIMHIDALVKPITSKLRVWAFDDQLVQHGLNYPRHRPDVLTRVYLATASWARLLAILLGVPSVGEAFTAEVVVTGELDGLIEGRVADEADEVAIGRGAIFEQVDVGRLFGNGTLAVLRVQ
jgi:hypothetical protein